jgi:hypothetical protein
MKGRAMSVTLGRDVQTYKWVKLGDIERRSGLYVVGRPGMGKSTLLVTIMSADLWHGHGIFFIDPHGDAIDDLLKLLTLNDRSHALLFDPEDEQYSFGINLLLCKDITSLKERNNTYTRIYTVFQKLFENEHGELGVWLQLIMQNIIPVFIENPDYTIAEMPLFLTDSDFRKHLLGNVKHETTVLDFWQREFQPKQAEAAITRIRMLLGNSYVRHIVGQPKTTIHFVDFLNQNNIVLFKLSANLSPDIKRFIGTILTSELLYAIRSRPSENRQQFCIFVDEFQHFVTDQFAEIILEGRKYGCACCLSHQERYGQLGDNLKIQAATMACANKVIFQVTPRDAQEFSLEFAETAKEEAEPWRGGELIISPTAVEDMWKKGHPDKNIMKIRQQYFWLVDLLRTNPQEKYFEFDRNHIPHFHQGNKGRLHADTFDDWGLYRSSAKMIREGITILNNYYYDWMNYKYDIRKPVTDAEVQIFLKLVLCFGGVFGFRPSMTAYLPDDKRHLLNNAMHKGDIQLQKDLLASLTPPQLPYRGKVDPSIASIIEDGDKRIMDMYRQQKQDREDKLMRLEAHGPRDELPRELHYGAVKDVPWFAMMQGISAHEAENMVEWEMREPFSHEKECLTEFIRKTLNSRIDDRVDYRLIEQYTTIMTDLVFRGMFGNDYMAQKQDAYQANLKRVVERIAWQYSEMQAFILFCSHPAGITLEHLPIKVATGKYEENPKRERTQRELFDEKVQELSNLPRFTAYAKILHEKNGRQTVLKKKFNTEAYSKSSETWLENAKRRTTQNAHKYGTMRTEIEEQLRERRESWKPQPPEPPKQPTRFTLAKAMKKDDDKPPPRGF